MLNHKVETPFKCDQCEKRFKIKQQVDRHSYEVHSGIRPFICHICASTFNVNGNLQVTSQTISFIQRCKHNSIFNIFRNICEQFIAIRRDRSWRSHNGLCGCLSMFYPLAPTSHLCGHRLNSNHKFLHYIISK